MNKLTNAIKAVLGYIAGVFVPTAFTAALGFSAHPVVGVSFAIFGFICWNAEHERLNKDYSRRAK